MAYNYTKIKEAYEQLNDAQKKQFDSENKSNANYQRFIKEYQEEQSKISASTNKNTQTSSNNYEHQGAWVYEYNPATWYYENKSDTSKNTVNQNLNTNTNKSTNTNTNTNNKVVSDGYYDQNNNLHITNNDGSTQVIPAGQTSGWTKTQQGTQWGQSGLSADGKTYTFQEWYEPIYPEGTIVSDKSTGIANQGKLQQKSQTLTYQEDSEDRYNQILNNLERIYVSNPEYFTDRTTFDANFQLDQRSIGQQKLMVEWFYQKKKEQNDYDTVSGLNSGENVYDAVNGGWLTYDQLDLLKWTNPDLYSEYLSITQDKVNLATINNDPAMFFINSMPETLEDLRNEIMATIGEMNWYKPRAYMLELYDDANYYRVRNRVEESTANALEIKAEYDSIESTVRSRLEWTGASKAYINACIAREQNDMIPRVNTAYAQLQADTSNYNLRHQSVEDKYGAYIDEANYEINKYNAQVGAFQTMWNTYKDVAQYDWNYKQQVRLAKLQESYNNPKIDSDDPDEARRALKQALQTYYDTYWPIIKRDINKVMEDIYAYAKKNWVSLSTALQKDFVDQLEAKSEYKELQKQYLYGREYLYSKPWTSSSSNSSSSSSAGGAGWSVYGSGDNWWQQTSNVSSSTASTEKVEKAVSELESRVWNQWGTDEDFVNSYLESLWLWSDNIKSDYDSKVDLINDYTPQVWSIAIIDSEKWRVWVVSKVDSSTWKISIISSDAYGDGKIHEVSNYDSSDIKWYINPSKALTFQEFNGSLPQTEFTSKEGKILRLNQYGYLDALIPQYKEYNANGWISSSVAWLTETLESNGVSWNDFRSQAQNYSKFGAEAQSYLNTLVDELNQITYLYENVGNYSRLKRGLWGESNAWYQSYLNLIKKLTLGYFIDLKSQWATFGSMTEWEWKLVWEASSIIAGYQDDVRLNKENIMNELEVMARNLSRIIEGMPSYPYSWYAPVYSSNNPENGAGRT